MIDLYAASETVVQDCQPLIELLDTLQVYITSLEIDADDLVFGLHLEAMLEKRYQKSKNCSVK